MCSARNLEMSIHFSLKSRPSERFHRPEMFQIKAEIRKQKTWCLDAEFVYTDAKISNNHSEIKFDPLPPI